MKNYNKFPEANVKNEKIIPSEIEAKVLREREVNDALNKRIEELDVEVKSKDIRIEELEKAMSSTDKKEEKSKALKQKIKDLEYKNVTYFNVNKELEESKKKAEELFNANIKVKDDEIERIKGEINAMGDLKKQNEELISNHKAELEVQKLKIIELYKEQLKLDTDELNNKIISLEDIIKGYEDKFRSENAVNEKCEKFLSDCNLSLKTCDSERAEMSLFSLKLQEASKKIKEELDACDFEKKDFKNKYSTIEESNAEIQLNLDKIIKELDEVQREKDNYTKFLDDLSEYIKIDKEKMLSKKFLFDESEKDNKIKLIASMLTNRSKDLRNNLEIDNKFKVFEDSLNDIMKVSELGLEDEFMKSNLLGLRGFVETKDFLVQILGVCKFQDLLERLLNSSDLERVKIIGILNNGFKTNLDPKKIQITIELLRYIEKEGDIISALNAKGNRLLTKEDLAIYKEFSKNLIEKGFTRSNFYKVYENNDITLENANEKASEVYKKYNEFVKKLEFLRKQFDDLTSKNKTMESEINKMEKDLPDLEKKRVELEVKYGNLNEKLSMKGEKIYDLELGIEKLSEVNIMESERYKVVKDRINLLESEIQKRESEMENIQKINFEGINTIREQNKNLKEIKEEIKLKEDAILKKDTELQDLFNEKLSLNEDLTNKVIEIETSKKNLSKLTEIQIGLDLKISTLEFDLKDSKEKYLSLIGEKAKNIEEIQKLNEIVKRTEDDISKQKLEFNLLSVKFDKAMEVSKNLTDENNSINITLTELRKEDEISKSNKAWQDEEIKNFKKMIEVYEKSTEEYKVNILSKQEALRVLNKENAKIQKRNDEVVKKILESKVINDDVKEMNDKLKQDLNKIKEENNILVEKNIHLTEEIDKQIAIYEDLKEINLKLEKNYAELKIEIEYEKKLNIQSIAFKHISNVAVDIMIGFKDSQIKALKEKVSFIDKIKNDNAEIKEKLILYKEKINKINDYPQGKAIEEYQIKKIKRFNVFRTQSKIKIIKTYSNKYENVIMDPEDFYLLKDKNDIDIEMMFDKDTIVNLKGIN